jgi:hypothetical protein
MEVVKKKLCSIRNSNKINKYIHSRRRSRNTGSSFFSLLSFFCLFFFLFIKLEMKFLYLGLVCCSSRYRNVCVCVCAWCVFRVSRQLSFDCYYYILLNSLMNSVKNLLLPSNTRSLHISFRLNQFSFFFFFCSFFFCHFPINQLINQTYIYIFEKLGHIDLFFFFCV